VVSSRSILTAAHCVLDSRSVAGSGHRAYRDLSGIWLTNGGNFTMAAGARWFRVQRVAAHESFPDASDRHDIALIQVEGDLQLPAAMLANGLSAGSAMTSVGYGCNNNPFARSGGGIRRTASAYVDNLSEATFESVGGEICPGDSGGPALVPSTFGGDQTSVVAGVASWLFWNHERQVTRSVYARVDTAEMHAWLRAEDPAIVTDAPNGVDNSNGNNTF
jgi:secreted trypsin-like serine protease